MGHDARGVIEYDPPIEPGKLYPGSLMHAEPMPRNHRMRTRSQMIVATQHNVHQCLNQGLVCGREIHALLFGRNGNDYIDCELHQMHWHPCLLDSTMGNWYHEQMMFYVTSVGIAPYGSRRRELSWAVLHGMLAIQEMIWDGLVTEQCSQAHFKGFGTGVDESVLERTSSHAIAHFVLSDGPYLSQNIFACDVTAHHLAEVDDAWLAEGADPMSEHSENNPLYPIIGPVLLSLHMHHCVTVAFDRVQGVQEVIRRWTRLALVCRSWLHGATGKIKSLIASRDSFAGILKKLILGIGTGEGYHRDPIQLEGLDETYLDCEEQVQQVALGLHD